MDHIHLHCSLIRILRKLPFDLSGMHWVQAAAMVRVQEKTLRNGGSSIMHLLDDFEGREFCSHFR